MSKITIDELERILEAEKRRQEEITREHWKRILIKEGDSGKARIRAEAGLKKEDSINLIKELEEEIKREK